MTTDPRLASLLQAIANITGGQIPDGAMTIGALAIDSRDLVNVILACEDIYGGEIDLTRMHLDYDTPVREIHDQIVEAMVA